MEDDTLLNSYRENDTNERKRLTDSILQSSYIAKEIQDHLIKIDESINEGNIQSSKIFLVIPNKEAIEIDLSLAIKGYPSLLSRLNLQNKTVELPEWIDPKYLMNYYRYIESNYDHKEKINLKKIIQLANFFKAEQILRDIFHIRIIPNLNYDNSLSIILDAYRHCSSNDIPNANIKNIWLNLFICVLEYVSKNFLIFLQRDYDKLLKLDCNLLDEILEKFLLKHLNIKINSHQSDLLFKLIVHLRNLNKNITNKEEIEMIAPLIENETKLLSTQENIKALSSQLNPTFKLNLDNEFNYSYQEYIITLHKQKLQVTLNYNYHEDYLNISLKLVKQGNRSGHILSLLSCVYFTEDRNTMQINIKSFNEKQDVNIFKFQGYKNLIEEKSLTLVVNLKLCFIHSFLMGYLNANFSKVHRFTNLNKLNKNLFTVLMKNDTLAKENDDQIVTAVMNWCRFNLIYFSV